MPVKGRRITSRTLADAPKLVDVPVKGCKTWTERLIVELDELPDKISEEGSLTHDEGTGFHRALVSYLMTLAQSRHFWNMELKS